MDSSNYHINYQMMIIRFRVNVPVLQLNAFIPFPYYAYLVSNETAVDCRTSSMEWMTVSGKVPRSPGQWYAKCDVTAACRRIGHTLRQVGDKFELNKCKSALCRFIKKSALLKCLPSLTDEHARSVVVVTTCPEY